MNRIAVATDFSTRSDRAVRRGVLLAKSFGASLSLLHAVDDDQPQRAIDAAARLAEELLAEQARALAEIDGLACTFRVALGDPFEAVARTAADTASDLVILGPHRRQALRDVFLGTTAERIIQRAAMAVVMANAMPAGPYRHALLAVDFSPGATEAVHAFQRLGMDRRMATSVIHVHDLPGDGLVAGGVATQAGRRAALAAAGKRAAADLAAFVARLGLDPVHQAAIASGGSTARTIGEAAASLGADLIIVGTRGQGGMARLFLGSVTAEILRIARQDVMAVPPSQAATA